MLTKEIKDGREAALKPCMYINLFSLCLNVCLYLINVKTSKPIRPKFCLGPHMTLEKQIYPAATY